MTYNQNKLYNIWDCLFRDMFNFDFLWKGMRLSPPPHFLHDFQEIYFSCCSLLTDQISCLIAFTWDIVPILWRHKFETTLAFLSSCFPIWPKMAGEKFKYLKNEKSFKKHFSTFLRLDFWEQKVLKSTYQGCFA